MEEHQVSGRALLLVLLAVVLVAVVPLLVDAVSGALGDNCPTAGSGLDTPEVCP